MSIADAAPLRKLDFSPRPNDFLKNFAKNTERMMHLLGENPRLDELISAFEDPKSPSFASISKTINLLKNAANMRKFTLTPLIARYNQDSEEIHHVQNILLNNKEIKIIFIRPVFEIEGIIYAYHLFIPIPIDMLEKDSQSLLKDHWNMVTETIPRLMQSTLLKRLIPMYTIGRVYGWDSAYLAYEAAVCDDGNFWSMPLVSSPFNGIQPFLATEDGEFVIIERDETDVSKKETTNVINNIKKRVHNNRYISFHEGKSISISPEFFAASIDYSEPQINLKTITKELGGKLGPISIDRCLPETTKELFGLMQAQVFGTPQYVFSESEIEKFKFRSKL